MKEIFLDANAHQPLNTNALAAYQEFSSSRAGQGNPASPSVPGQEAAAALERARNQIAELLGVESKNIIFTNTCTQAAEWAIKIFDNIKSPNKDDKFVSPVEHPAVRGLTKTWNKLKINKNGVIEPIEANKIACIHMQNEIGTIQPLHKIKAHYLFTDMCQSLGKVPVNLDNVDVAIFGAHKFGGPANVGFFYLKEPSWWIPYGTGSRYGSDRPGTMDVASIVATSVALKEALESQSRRFEKASEFRHVLESGLKQMEFEIIGEGADRSPNTTFVQVPKGKAHLLLSNLGKERIHVGLGSACGAMYSGNNPTMKTLGINAGTNDLIRFSQAGLYGALEAGYVLHTISKVFKE